MRYLLKVTCVLQQKSSELNQAHFIGQGRTWFHSEHSFEHDQLKMLASGLQIQILYCFINPCNFFYSVISLYHIMSENCHHSIRGAAITLQQFYVCISQAVTFLLCSIYTVNTGPVIMITIVWVTCERRFTSVSLWLVPNIHLCRLCEPYWTQTIIKHKYHNV